MERWSIKFFNKTHNRWERNYYYSLREFAVARDKIKENPEVDQEKVYTNYERFPAPEVTVCPVCSADLSAGHYYSCPKFEM